MSSTDQDDDEQIETLPAPYDRFADAIALCQIAKNKTIATQLKKLRRVIRQVADAEAKVIAVEDQAAQKETALAAREAELDEREAEIERRETEFENSLQEARDHLRRYHDSLADTDRRIRYRILSSADLLHGFNERLQDLPDWPAIKQMIPGLPADLPAAPPAEVVSENVREDWAGSIFTPGSSLTRTINKAAS